MATNNSNSNTEGIGYENALAKFKILSLKSLESWVKKVCDDKEESVIKELVSADNYDTIPGTTRKYLRLNKNQDKFYCVHFINDWDDLWQYLACTPYDEFGSSCVHFRNYCMFLFHGKTAIILTSFQVYITLVGFVAIAIDFESTAYWIYKISSITIFYGIYLATYAIFRGTMLKTDNLRAFVGNRVVLDRTVDMVDATSLALAYDAGGDSIDMENDLISNPMFDTSTNSNYNSTIPSAVPIHINSGSEKNNVADGTDTDTDDIEFESINNASSSSHSGGHSNGTVPAVREDSWCKLWYLLWKAIFLTLLAPILFFLENVWRSFKQFLYSTGDASMRNRMESSVTRGTKSKSTNQTQTNKLRFEHEKEKEKEIQSSSLNATSSLRSFFRKGWNSVVVASSVRKSGETLGFYHLLNVCQKFLVIFGDKGMKKSPPLLIQQILSGVMIYAFVNTYSSVITGNSIIHSICITKDYPTTHEANEPNYSPEFCRAFEFYQIATIGGFITSTIAITTCSSLFVSFAGLAYAADIAQKLASIWITRYQPIRKVEYDGLMGPNTDTATDEEITSYFSDVLHNYMHAMNADCLPSPSPSGASVGGDPSNSMDNTVNGGKDATDSNSNTNTNSTEPPSLESIAAKAGIDINIKDLVKLLPLFDKDATECFLFRQVYMQLITTVWNPFLVWLVVTMLAIVIMGAATAYSVKGLINNLTLTAVVILYPLVCVAYSNNAIKELVQFTTGAGLDDFKLLGGRTVWLDYAQNNTSYWCILDIPFTCELVGFV